MLVYNTLKQQEVIQYVHVLCLMHLFSLHFNNTSGFFFFQHCNKYNAYYAFVIDFYNFYAQFHVSKS